MLAGLAALADDHMNCPFAGAAHHVQLEGVTGSGLERAEALLDLDSCDRTRCCATLIMRMSATLILGMSWLWKTPPDGVRRGWVVLGLSRVVLRVSR